MEHKEFIELRKKVHTEYVDSLPNIKKICPHCSKEYITKYVLKKYCCGRCRDSFLAKQYNHTHKERITATYIANTSIPILTNQFCEHCKIAKAKHRHHEDYSKPLEVIFLCRSCHKRKHKVNYKHKDK